MKPRLIALAVAAALGPGCATPDKPRAAMDIEPVLSVRHGAPEAQAQYQLGRYYQGQYRYEQAELAYMRALALDSRHIDALNALATLYAAQGNLQGSAQMLERVVAMAPDAAYLYNNLGFAYFLQGRFEDAFGAVRKALRLDPTLDRAWANLERIADLTPEGKVIAVAVKARRLEDIPLQLAAAGTPAAGPSAEQAPADAAPVVAAQNPGEEPDGRAVLVAGESARDGEHFSLVTTAGDVVAEGGTVELGGPTSAAAPTPATAAATEIHPVQPATTKEDYRLEVANGNGVAGFARRYSERLRSQDIPVARITNNHSFLLAQSQIEFEPGYERAARTLMSSTGLPARLIGATNLRPRAEVRLVLGRDALERWDG
ncbi:MAG: LytR C-terminal domain-containing protein [Rhodocyclaceae bacterium]